MKGYVACWLAALALACAGAAPRLGAAEAQAPGKARDQSASKELQPSELRVYRTTLRDLTGLNALSLRGTDGSATATFGGRADELVTRVVLRLRYSHSPALLFGQSHLRVLLNDETAEIIPFTKETANGSNERVVQLDPRFVGDLNRLRFQFVGHYAAECEDLLHSSLWAEVSGASELEITSRPIVVPSDLALLPEPFFDRRDLRRLRLPFVFPRDPSLGIVRAGGIAASWFGQLAGWRGARFPVSMGEGVRGHAVVLATNDRRPDFLGDQARVDGPTLRIVNNPIDGYSKLLLVLGRNEADLQVAVEGLVYGSAAFSGAETRVQAVRREAPSRAYDAPLWVRPDRPTKFGELVASSSDLQAQGHTPAWIRVGVRVPPDLFMWRSPGVPLDLKFRHNAAATSSGAISRLTVGVNGELLRSFELRSGDGMATPTRIRVPFLDPRAPSVHSDASIPAFALGARNELQFAFNFAVPRQGGCRDAYVQNIGGAIDPDSTIDFSGFSHYAALPNLGYFASAGFPFTRHADLSETIAIMPATPNAQEIETFITLLGRMGESTGAPATAVRVLPPGDPGQYRDADLLMIGTAARLTLLKQWQEHLPAIVDGPARRLSLPVEQSTTPSSSLAAGVEADGGIAVRTEVVGAGPIAAFVGFESPVTRKRSVVLVTANVSESLHVALESLEDAGLVHAMYGSSVLMHDKRVESYRVGDRYFVGDLPVWTWLWYHLADFPLAVAALGLLASLLFALIAWRGLRKVARRRLDGTS